MSTIKVNKIESTATTNGGVQIDVDGHVTIDGQQLPTAGPLSNRNLIINGAMQVAQRGTSQTGLGNNDSNYHTVDRFRWAEGGNVTFEQTMAQSTDGPTGFSNSLRVDTTTAMASLPANGQNFIEYRVEAQDLQQLSYGTASARSFTISFYVKSNVTGNYVVFFRNDSNTASCTHLYTINSANVWELQTITVTGDTANAFANDNTTGLTIRWILGAGTNFTSGTATETWDSANTEANRYVGQAVNIAASTDNDWSITGVQLEVGSKSTPFEYRSYGDELARCMRYFQIIDGTVSGGALTIGNGCTRSANNTHMQIPLGIALRDKPALSVTNTVRIAHAGNSQTSASNSPTINGVTPSVHTDNTNFNVTLNYNGNISYSIGANQGGIAMMLNTPGTLRLDSEL